MKAPRTMAVTNGDTHHRSVRRVRAEIATRPDCARPGWATPDGGGDEVEVMTSIPVRGNRPAWSVQAWSVQPAATAAVQQIAPGQRRTRAMTHSKPSRWQASKTW